MRAEVCPWCGKPLPDQLENSLEFPVRYHGRDYCPGCLLQLMHNTIL